MSKELEDKLAILGVDEDTLISQNEQLHAQIESLNADKKAGRKALTDQQTALEEARAELVNAHGDEHPTITAVDALIAKIEAKLGKTPVPTETTTDAPATPDAPTADVGQNVSSGAETASPQQSDVTSEPTNIPGPNAPSGVVSGGETTPQSEARDEARQLQDQKTAAEQGQGESPTESVTPQGDVQTAAGNTSGSDAIMTPQPANQVQTDESGRPVIGGNSDAGLPPGMFDPNSVNVDGITAVATKSDGTMAAGSLAASVPLGQTHVDSGDAVGILPGATNADGTTADGTLPVAPESQNAVNGGGTEGNETQPV